MSKVELILCPYDFSETSERALLQGAALAHAHGARLLLAHVVESVPVSTYPVIRPPNSDWAIRDIAESRVRDVADRLRRDGIEVDVDVRVGQTGSEIVAIGDESNADAIVIGTRGLNALKHLLLGSTAEYVVRRSAAPVLAIHPEDECLAPPIQAVVVPTDLAAESAFAVDALTELFPKDEKPVLYLVHADQVPAYLAPFSHAELARVGHEDVMKEELLKRMDGAADHATTAGFEVRREVVDGEPSAAIPDFANRVGADLISMSTHGRSAVGNFLRGRIAQRIVQHARCPVLACRASRA